MRQITDMPSPLPHDENHASSGAAALARTLVKGLGVLEAFRDGERTLGNSEIAVRTGLTRPTVARLTKTLAELGYLSYEPARAKYRLAGGLLKLAHPLLADMGVRQIARPLMQELADAVRGVVSIGIVEGIDMVYVETARASEAVGRHIPDIGSAIPLPQAAMGRALCSMLPPGAAHALRARIQREAGEVWARFGDRMDEGLRECAERGFCISKGDWVEAVHAAATPLLTDRRTGVAFALNCGVQSFRLAPGQMESEIGPRLVSLAASIRALCDERGIA